ncbi:MAG TPA: AMP-binding protein, partial [Acidimicrobiales bacterium]|nr:AMP-binding protein [Acidimicrobiales bacterium]
GRPLMLADVVTAPDRRAAYERAGHWDQETLAARVRAHAAARPEATAVVDHDGARRHTYGELDRDVRSLAGWLAEDGVTAGDVVSVQLPNWYEFVVAAVAAQRLGAVINPLLPVYRRKELLHVFTVAAPKVVFTPSTYRGHDHAAATADAIAESGVKVHHVVVDGGLPDGAPLGPTAHTEDAADVSELIFTSGTEAAPKAIMHTEQTANFSVRVAFSDLGMGTDDVVWMPSPIGHSTGFNYGVRFALYHGLPLVLQDRWDAATACDLIAGEGASYTLASTTFLQDLVGEAERRGVALPSMQRFGCGGAPVPPELVRRASARGIGVLRLYGSTEALVATWNRPWSPEDKKVATDGLAMTDVDVEVRADGEIFTRGPNTCVGFYLDPDRTAATFDDGWVRSGDLATIDADGYLTVVGRKKEIIIRGGMNITPREIEELLLAFPEVDRAAVVGLPDERLGERVCACLVLHPGQRLELKDVVARLRTIGLATYKLPERLEVLDALPMTASGKVQKFEIVQRLTSSPGSPGSSG